MSLRFCIFILMIKRQAPFKKIAESVPNLTFDVGRSMFEVQIFLNYRQLLKNGILIQSLKAFSCYQSLNKGPIFITQKRATPNSRVTLK